MEEVPMKMMFRRAAMRAGAVALCSAALCAVPMMAQGGGGGGRGGMTPEARVAAIDTAVTLTADQKTKITAILTDDQKKMADLRASGEDMSTLMPKIQAMRTDENAKIKALLTDEQKPKFDAWVAAQPAYGGRRGGGGGAPGGGAPPAPPQ
jgi:Spy/CpxP family protein refolding chaperone